MSEIRANDIQPNRIDYCTSVLLYVFADADLLGYLTVQRKENKKQKERKICSCRSSGLCHFICIHLPAACCVRVCYVLVELFASLSKVDI